MPLTQIRQEINQVDQELVALLEKRMGLVDQILTSKKASGQPIFDPEREAQVLDKVSHLVTEEAYKETILATFGDMMARSRTYQENQL